MFFVHFNSYYYLLLLLRRYYYYYFSYDSHKTHGIQNVTFSIRKDIDIESTACTTAHTSYKLISVKLRHPSSWMCRELYNLQRILGTYRYVHSAQRIIEGFIWLDDDCKIHFNGENCVSSHQAVVVIDDKLIRYVGRVRWILVLGIRGERLVST